MTNQEKLKLIIEKAEKGGFCVPIQIHREMFFYETNYCIRDFELIELEEVARIFIFDKDFAKAYWKDDKEPETKPIVNQKTALIEWSPETWKYHLQQMVLEEEPIQYLAKFLDD